MNFAEFFRLSILLICVLVPLLSDVQVIEADDTVDIDVSTGLFSHYIWRGQCLSDTPVIQPSATVTFLGLSANVWANYDTDSGRFNEVDYTLSGSYSIDRLTLGAGFIHYDLRHGLDSDELYCSVEYDTILSPKLTVYYDIDEGTGAFFVASAGHAIALPADISLTLGGSLSYIMDAGWVGVNADGEEFSGFYNGDLTVNAEIPVFEFLCLTPMIGYTTAMGGDARDSIEAVSADRADNTLYGGVILNLSF